VNRLWIQFRDLKNKLENANIDTVKEYLAERQAHILDAAKLNVRPYTVNLSGAALAVLSGFILLVKNAEKEKIAEYPKYFEWSLEDYEMTKCEPGYQFHFRRMRCMPNSVPFLTGEHDVRIKYELWREQEKAASVNRAQAFLNEGPKALFAADTQAFITKEVLDRASRLDAYSSDASDEEDEQTSLSQEGKALPRHLRIFKREKTSETKVKKQLVPPPSVAKPQLKPLNIDDKCALDEYYGPNDECINFDTLKNFELDCDEEEDEFEDWKHLECVPGDKKLSDVDNKYYKQKYQAFQRIF
jgi:hypothetical protein